MNGSPMLVGIRSSSRSVAVFLASGAGGGARLDERGALAGVDQVGECQADQHRHQGVDQIKEPS